FDVVSCYGIGATNNGLFVTGQGYQSWTGGGLGPGLHVFAKSAHDTVPRAGIIRVYYQVAPASAAATTEGFAQILSVPSTHQFPYRIRTAPDPSPLPGQVSGNDADGTLITIVYLHKLDDELPSGTDISLFVQELGAGDELNAHESADVTNNRFYAVTDTPTLVGDVWHIPVVFISGAGTPLMNNELVQIYLKHV
ncbi:unnamed protein product, partial [marine sediment metagenome]